MIEILQMIERVLFYMLLALVVLYALSGKRNVSLLITVVVVFLSELIIDYPTEAIFPFVQPLLTPVLYKTFVYSVFTAADLLAVFGILQLHKLYHESLGLAARQASLSLLILGFIQIVFFVISFFIDRSLFVELYLTSNSSLSITISIMLLGCIARDLFPFEVSIKREQKS